MNTTQRILLLSIAVLAGIGGSLAYRFLSQPDVTATEQMRSAAQQENLDLQGQLRPDYRLASSNGEWVTAADFDGSVVLVNFWATWCAPCRKEMPMLKTLHDELGDNGLEVVGIALDDVAQARSYVEELGIDYSILVGTTDVMDVGRRYGNVSGVLPYSVLLDRQGIVRWTYLGELQEKDLREQISQLLNPLIENT